MCVHVCVCVCVCARARARACVCVSVCTFSFVDLIEFCPELFLEDFRFLVLLGLGSVCVCTCARARVHARARTRARAFVSFTGICRCLFIAFLLVVAELAPARTFGCSGVRARVRACMHLQMFVHRG